MSAARRGLFSSPEESKEQKAVSFEEQIQQELNEYFVKVNDKNKVELKDERGETAGLHPKEWTHVLSSATIDHAVYAIFTLSNQNIWRSNSLEPYGGPDKLELKLFEIEKELNSNSFNFNEYPQHAMQLTGLNQEIKALGSHIAILERGDKRTLSFYKIDRETGFTLVGKPIILNNDKRYHLYTLANSNLFIIGVDNPPFNQDSDEAPDPRLSTLMLCHFNGEGIKQLAVITDSFAVHNNNDKEIQPRIEDHQVIIQLPNKYIIFDLETFANEKVFMEEKLVRKEEAVVKKEVAVACQKLKDSRPSLQYYQRVQSITHTAINEVAKDFPSPLMGIITSYQGREPWEFVRENPENDSKVKVILDGLQKLMSRVSATSEFKGAKKEILVRAITDLQEGLRLSREKTYSELAQAAQLPLDADVKPKRCSIFCCSAPEDHRPFYAAFGKILDQLSSLDVIAYRKNMRGR